MKHNLTSLLSKYQPAGLVKGNILILPPAEALQLAGELKSLAIPIVGVELWYYTRHEGKEYLTEDPSGPDFSELLGTPAAVEATIAAAQHYLVHELPERIVYVSFVLDTDEPYWQAWQSQKLTKVVS